MDNGEIDLWATHLAVLAAMVSNTTGPVLELGCGHYSTRILHALCDGRRLVTCDTNPEWVEKFEHLRNNGHEIVCAPNTERYLAEAINSYISSEQYWEIVFVDEAPAQHRIIEIARLRPVTKWFIVNNTEPGRPVYKYDQLLPSFPYRWDYKRYPVWTSVISDNPLPDWLERLL